MRLPAWIPMDMRSMYDPKILDGIPEGTWVAISNDHLRVAGKGSTLEEAMYESTMNGELDPLITRVFRGALIL